MSSESLSLSSSVCVWVCVCMCVSSIIVPALKKIQEAVASSVSAE